MTYVLGYGLAFKLNSRNSFYKIYTDTKDNKKFNI